MSWLYVAYLPVSMVVLLSTLAMAFYAARQRSFPGGTAFALSMLLAAWLDFATAGLMLSPTVEAARSWYDLFYLSPAFIPVTWLVFVGRYSGRAWFTRRQIGGLLIIPIITQLLIWTNPLHHGWLLGPVTIVPAGPYLVYDRASCLFGPWFVVYSVYTYALFLLATIWLISLTRRTFAIFRGQAVALFLGGIIPVLADVALTLGLASTPPLNTLPVMPSALALSGLAWLWGISYRGMFNLVPIARHQLIDGLPDAMLVLDHLGRLIDLNPAMVRLFNLHPIDVIGRSGLEVCAAWPELALNLPALSNQAVEIRGPIGGPPAYYSVQGIPLSDGQAYQRGRVIVARDITAYRQANAELRRVHEELEQRVAARTAELAALNATLEHRVATRTYELTALYGISALTSQTYTLESMLPQALIVTLQAVTGLAGLIGLFDRSDANQPAVWRVVAQHTTAMVDLIELQAWLKTSGLIDTVQAERAPSLIPALKLGQSTLTLVVAPMQVEGDVIGMLLVGRDAGQAFAVNEVALLIALADQIGAAVATDQLRQLAQQATVLAERQRIARDLHDATTQSLYGLITLVEAMRAQLAAGQPVTVTLERVADTTRQALKEMRLFVFQLQPPDVAELGLINALHHRLAAVEGRARMQARLLADETIELAAPLEAAIYFIVQEALNNVLRHAAASTVTVYLGQEHGRVVVEVRDNGIGFDTTTLRPGGMGLTNMRARAAAIGAEFKIISQPGQGTRVKITV